MAMFNRYVSLPEGSRWFSSSQLEMYIAPTFPTELTGVGAICQVVPSSLQLVDGVR